jgi:hypothetical protein
MRLYMRGLQLARSTALPPEECRGRTHPLSERQVVALCAGFGLIVGMLETLGRPRRCATTGACRHALSPWLNHGFVLAAAGLAIGILVGLCLVLAWRLIRRTVVDPLLIRRHRATAGPPPPRPDGLTDMRGFELALRAARARERRPHPGGPEQG